MTSETAESRITAEHALKVVAALEDLRARKFACDFTMSVEGQVFQAHRNVLIAGSGYFRGMLLHDTRESQEGTVCIQNIKAATFERCLKFLYSGKTENLESIEEVQQVLYASEMLQLPGLTELCFQYLEKNLCSSNCLTANAIAKLYFRKDISKKAKKMMRDNFKEVVSTQDFLYLRLPDLKKALTKVETTHDVKWRAVYTWSSHNGSQYLCSLLKTIKIEMFPFQFILKDLLNNSLVQGKDTARTQVLESLFSDEEKLEQNIDVGNLFLLKSLVKSWDDVKSASANDVIDKFMLCNFHQVIKSEDFMTLETADVFRILQSQSQKDIYTEILKWKALVKWVTQHKRRKQVFPRLFKHINYRKLRLIEIKEIREMELVKESAECSSAVSPENLKCVDLKSHSVMKQRLEQREQQRERSKLNMIAVLNKSSDEVRFINLEDRLPEKTLPIPKGNYIGIVQLEDELWVIAEDKVHLLRRYGNWESLQTPELMSSQDGQVIVMKERIFIVHKSKMMTFCPLQRKWNKLPGCMLERGFCIAAAQRHVYAIGGIMGNKAKRYDFEAGMWFWIKNMLDERFYPSAAELNDHIYVMGGMWEDSPLSSAEFYSPEKEEWTKIANMQACRCLFGAFVIKNKLYVVGGTSGLSGTVADRDSIEMYCNDKWNTVYKVDDVMACVSASSVSFETYEWNAFDDCKELAESIDSISNEWLEQSTVQVGRKERTVKMRGTSVKLPPGAMNKETAITFKIFNKPNDIPDDLVPISSLLTMLPVVTFDLPVAIEIATFYSADAKRVISVSILTKEEENGVWKTEEVVLKDRNEIKFQRHRFSQVCVAVSTKRFLQGNFHFFSDFYIQKDTTTVIAFLSKNKISYEALRFLKAKNFTKFLPATGLVQGKVDDRVDLAIKVSGEDVVHYQDFVISRTVVNKNIYYIIFKPLCKMNDEGLCIAADCAIAVEGRELIECELIADLPVFVFLCNSVEFLQFQPLLLTL